jgi:hypothetical protein
MKGRAKRGRQQSAKTTAASVLEGTYLKKTKAKGFLKKGLGHVSVAQLILKIGWSERSEDQVLHQALREEYSARITADEVDPGGNIDIGYKTATANAYFDKLSDAEREIWLKLTGKENERLRVEHDRQTKGVIAAFSPSNSDAELILYVTRLHDSLSHSHGRRRARQDLPDVMLSILQHLQDRYQMHFSLIGGCPPSSNGGKFSVVSAHVGETFESRKTWRAFDDRFFCGVVNHYTTFLRGTMGKCIIGPSVH